MQGRADGNSDSSGKECMKIENSSFGTTSDGCQVTAYTVTNSKGACITVLDLGAVLQSVGMPDRNGTITDVVLGYDNVEAYEVNPPFFGATIGRNGNRIEGGSFSLDGVDYTLALNENDRNNLHSGPYGYQKRMWGVTTDEEHGSVSFSLHSPDGDQGFPGNFDVTVTYTLTEEDEVRISYEGRCDRSTVANMTNHSYFNLNGHSSGSIFNHLLQIQADGYVPVDENSIPYGTVEEVEGTPFDFRELRTIGRDAYAEDEQLEHTSGYDHNFALRGSGMREIAFAEGDVSGITMCVTTDLPGVQFYAGNMISGPTGKGGAEYRPHDGFCLETQYFPNSINVLAFDSPKLPEGELYRTVTGYKFGVRN